MVRNRTWIVIADSAHMTVLESVVGDSKLRFLPDMHLFADLPRTRNLVTDRPGRSFESHGRARHAIDARTDPRRGLKKSFAARIAARLKAELSKGAFEHLVLIAPPTALGDLRVELSKPLRTLVLAELPQDLVKMPTKKLRAHLRSALPTKVPLSTRSRMVRPNASKLKRQRH